MLSQAIVESEWCGKRAGLLLIRPVFGRDKGVCRDRLTESWSKCARRIEIHSNEWGPLLWDDHTVALIGGNHESVDSVSTRVRHILKALRSATHKVAMNEVADFVAASSVFPDDASDPIDLLIIALREISAFHSRNRLVLRAGSNSSWA